MIEFLVALILSLPVPLRGIPDMVGLATHYGPPAFCRGDTMANGEPLDLWGRTVAVDDSMKHLLNSEVYMLTECGQIYEVRVTDTGYLDEHCLLYRWGTKRVADWKVARYWCTQLPQTEGTPVLGFPILEEETEWEGEEYPLILDLPIGFRESIPCQKGETMKVAVWLKEER